MIKNCSGIRLLHERSRQVLKDCDSGLAFKGEVPVLNLKYKSRLSLNMILWKEVVMLCENTWELVFPLLWKIVYMENASYFTEKWLHFHLRPIHLSPWNAPFCGNHHHHMPFTPCHMPNSTFVHCPPGTCLQPPWNLLSRLPSSPFVIYMNGWLQKREQLSLHGD